MRKMILLCIALLFGCVSSPKLDSTSETVDVGPHDDEKADAGRWKVRAAETSVWFDTRVKPQDNGMFSLTGRLSRNIEVLSAAFQSGDPIAIKQKSKRTFEIFFKPEHTIRLAKGERIYASFETSAGEVNAMALYAPRLGSFAGDNEMFVLSGLHPVVTGPELQMRGRVSVPGGWELQVATSDIGVEGSVAHEPQYFTFDFPLAALPDLIGSAPLSFLATDVESQTITKTAVVRLRLVQVGATSDQPEDVWPANVCTDEIRRCLKSKPQDSEGCGYYNEVAPCLGSRSVEFSGDLAHAIRQYYSENSDAIRSREGRSLEDALSRISPLQVRDAEPFETAELDPEAQRGEIVWHGGVIFRESPHVWYGSYDPRGELIEIHLVNDILR